MENKQVKKEETVKIKFNVQYPIFVIRDDEIKLKSQYDAAQAIINIQCERGDTDEETQKLKISNSSKWSLPQIMNYLDKKYGTDKLFYNEGDIIELSKRLAEHYLTLPVGGYYKEYKQKLTDSGKFAGVEIIEKPFEDHIDPEVSGMGMYFDPRTKGTEGRIAREYQPSYVAQRV